MLIAPDPHVVDQMRVMCLWGSLGCIAAIVLLAIICLFRRPEEISEFVYCAGAVLAIAAVILWLSTA